MRLQVLARLGEVRRFGPGEIVFAEGQLGDEMFIIVHGCVRIERRAGGRQVTVAKLTPGSFFGEMAVLEDLPRAATAVAEETTTLIAIGRQQLRAAVEAEPELALRMLKVLSSRLRRVSTRVAHAASDQPPTESPPAVAPAATMAPAPARGAGALNEGPVARDAGSGDEATGRPDTSVPDGTGSQGTPSPESVVVGLPLSLDAPVPGFGDTRFVYEKDEQCPVCAQAFKAFHVRTSRLATASVDPDLRVHYREFDPLWHNVWVCPHCRYAAFRSDFGAVDRRRRQALAAQRAERLARPLKVNPQGGSPRTVAQAIDAVRLALMCAEAARPPGERLARLWLYLSWMYGDAGLADARQEARRRALQALERAYAQSRGPEEAQRLAYLTGLLHKELGNLRAAHEYLIKAIGHRTANSELESMARDLLAELRAARTPHEADEATP